MEANRSNRIVGEGSRRRRRVFRFFLVAFVTLATGIAAELIARIAWEPAFPFTMLLGPSYCWEPEPGQWEALPNLRVVMSAPRTNADGSSGGPEAGATRQVVFRFNSLGCRGPELAPRGADGLRVLFAGDSIVFGFLVDEDEAFTHGVGTRVGAGLCREVTVCNAAFPGYGFAAACARVRRLLPRVDPDAVVVGLCISNDFFDDIAQATSTVIAGRDLHGATVRSIRSRWRVELSIRSRLWLLGERVLASLAPGAAMFGPPAVTAEEASFWAGLPDVNHAKAGLYLEAVEDTRHWPGVAVLWQRFQDQLVELRRLVGNRRLLILLEPNRCHVDTTLRTRMLEELGFLEADYCSGLAQQRLIDRCAAAGVDVLDLTPALAAEGQPGRLFLSEDWVHYSVRGNAVVAAAIAERLVSMLRRR
jgi:hypothetical protein